jgi:hypothetical protein
MNRDPEPDAIDIPCAPLDDELPDIPAPRTLLEIAADVMSPFYRPKNRPAAASGGDPSHSGGPDRVLGPSAAPRLPSGRCSRCLFAECLCGNPAFEDYHGKGGI